MDRRSSDWNRLMGAREAGRPNPGAENDEDQMLVAYDPEPRCRVCALGAGEFGRAARKRIDWLLGLGYGYQEILEDVQGLLALVPEDQHPAYDSIRRHYERHLDPDSKLIRSMLERHAVEHGINIPEGQERVVTSAGVFDIVRQKGLEALVAGELKPTLRETLQAAHLLQTLEDESLRQQLGEMTLLVRTMLSLVRDRLSPDDAEAFSSLIQRPLKRSGQLALASTDPTAREDQEAAESNAGRSESTFTCDYCDKTTRTRSGLVRHTNAKHSQD
jgi:hypothetical protein